MIIDALARQRAGKEEAGRREFLISKGWIQAVILVVLFGFFVLGLLAYRTYMAQPPVPARVVDENGGLLFTGADVSKGLQVFLLRIHPVNFPSSTGSQGLRLRAGALDAEPHH